MKKDSISNIAVFVATLHLFAMYTRIQDTIPGLSVIPWVGVLGLIASLMGLLHLRVTHFRSFIGIIFWLAMWFAITGLGAISTVSYRIAIEWAFHYFPQFVLIYAVFTQPGWPKKLLKLWLVIYFVMALITIKNGGKGPGSFTGDENDVALAFAMGFPYCFYFLYLHNVSERWKIFSAVTGVLLVLGIVLSNSRGGFLGFVVVVFAIVWLSKSRVKIFSIAAAAAITVGGVAISLLPAEYVEDMRSISDKEDGTRVERLRTWEIGWEMFKDNPILGIGAGNVPNTAHLYESKTSWYDGTQKSLSGRQSHSLYFQVIPELGIVGISVMVYLLFWLPWKSIAIARKYTYEENNEEKVLLNILLVSIGGYVSAGAFISVFYYPNLPVWLLMFAVYKSLLEKDTSLKKIDS